MTHTQAVQQKLQVFRSHEPLQSLIQWGINHSVGLLFIFLSYVLLNEWRLAQYIVNLNSIQE